MWLFLLLSLLSLTAVGGAVLMRVSSIELGLVAGAVLFGQFALSFWRPRWGLYSVLFCLPLLNNVFFFERMGNVPPMLLVFFCFFGGWMLHRWDVSDNGRTRTPLTAPILALVGLCLASGLITMLRYARFFPFSGLPFESVTVNLLEETSIDAIEWAMQTLLVFLAGPALFWAALRLVSHRSHLRHSLYALALGLLPSIAFGIYQSRGHIELGNIPRFAGLGRINATFLDPNALGAFLVLAIPPIAALLVLSRRWAMRAAVFIFLVGALYVMGYSGSRTGMLGLILAFLIGGGLLLAHRDIVGLHHPGRWVMTVFMLAIGFAAFAPAPLATDRESTNILSRRMGETVEMIEQQGIVGMLQSQRWPMWQRGLRVALDYPVAGIGLGAYRTEIPNVMQWSSTEPYFRDNANNFYLQVWAETGLIGLAFWLVVLGILIREAFHLMHRPSTRRADHVLSAALCGSLGAMVILFLTGPHTFFTEVNFLFWFLAGLVFACLYRIPPVRPAASPRPWRIARIQVSRRMVAGSVSVILFGIFIASQSVDAITRLSLDTRRRQGGLASSRGFYSWEIGSNGERVRWTRDEAYVFVPAWRPILHMMLFVSNPDADREPVRVEILLNGIVAETEYFSQGGETRNVSILLPRSESGFVEVGFRVDRTYVPARSGGAARDLRELGVLVGEFHYSDVPEEGFGFAAWQRDEITGSLQFRTLHRQAAVSLPADRGRNYEVLASAVEGLEGEPPPRLRIFQENRLLAEEVLDGNAWRRIPIRLLPQDNQNPFLIRFEAEDSDRAVRITRLRPLLTR